MTCANLAFLESLDPDDVTWLLGTGREFQVNMDCQVIREGDTPEELYFVLAGLLGARVPGFGDALVATLGPGHVLGEISLLDDRPATASVFALENSQLLSCSRTLIADRLRTAQIERTMRETVGKITHVTTLACGPATEIFDAFERIPDSSALHVTLIDIDLQALAYVADRRDAAGLRRQTLHVPPQDLIYSIGLIDYFNDEFVLHLLNFAFDHIRPGGRAILGNFLPRNPAWAFQSVILDWPLIHRTESDLDAVFKASRFGTPCDEILADDAGIQLFGVVTRASS